MQGTGHLVLVTALSSASVVALGATGALGTPGALGSHVGVGVPALGSVGVLTTQGRETVSFRRPRLLAYAVEASPVPVLKGEGGPS